MRCLRKFWPAAVLVPLVGALATARPELDQALVTAAPEVNLTSGVWVGKDVETFSGGFYKVESFLGVRYAEAPVDETRFGYPVPASYSGRQDATTLGNACIQSAVLYVRSSIGFQFKNRSEDCLHLNIYRPKGIVNTPIAVYVHGGGFVGGYNGMFIYDPEELVSREGITVVLINYRLNLLGYLNLNAKEVPGNQGLHDIFLAMQFVKENARAFGGNPDEITVWGQSAGAFAIGFLLNSPKTDGLFRRAIMQSGSGASAATTMRLNTLNNAVKVARLVDCVDSGTSVEKQLEKIAKCLKKVDGQKLFSAFETAFNEEEKLSFQPQYGVGDLVPEFPFPEDSSKMHIGANLKEVLVSTVVEEGALFTDSIMSHFNALSAPLEDSPELFLALARGALRLLLDLPLSYIRERDITYFPPNETDSDTLRHSMSQLFADIYFGCPLDFYSEVLANRGVKVYRYLWDERPANSFWPTWTVATHSDDVAFTSGAILRFKEKAIESGQATSGLIAAANKLLPEAQKRLAYDSMKMIGSFVKKGLPVRPGGSVWPAYTAQERSIVRITRNSFQEFTGPLSQKCPLWKGFINNKVP